MNKIIGEYASLCTLSAWGVKLIAHFVFSVTLSRFGFILFPAVNT